MRPEGRSRLNGTLACCPAIENTPKNAEYLKQQLRRRDRGCAGRREQGQGLDQTCADKVQAPTAANQFDRLGRAVKPPISGVPAPVLGPLTGREDRLNRGFPKLDIEVVVIARLCVALLVRRGERHDGLAPDYGPRLAQLPDGDRIGDRQNRESRPCSAALRLRTYP